MTETNRGRVRNGFVACAIVATAIYLYDPGDVAQVKDARADLELLSHEWDRGESGTYVTGRIRNNSDRRYRSAQVGINLYDRSGNQIGSTSESVRNLRAGDTWAFRALVYEDEAVRYRIVEIDGY